MAEQEGVTEQLKAGSQMEWVGCMNNVHNRIIEIIDAELIFAWLTYRGAQGKFALRPSVYCLFNLFFSIIYLVRWPYVSKTSSEKYFL